MHDLLPLPYTEEALAHVVERVRRVQDALGRRIVLENVSSYLTFCDSALSEWEFLAAVAERADCGILLDVNNVFVSAFNHGFDAGDYLAGVPVERVVQFHLAGHSDHGTHLLDTHDHPVRDEVWALYATAVRRFGALPTLIEWDDRIPPFDRLHAEARRAAAVAAAAAAVMPTLHEAQRLLWQLIAAPEGVAAALAATPTAAARWRAALAAHRARRRRGSTPSQRLDIYANMYFFRVLDVLKEHYPATRALLGDVGFHNLITDYLLRHPPTHFSIREAGRHLPELLAQHACWPAHPCAADLARFERALNDAFDAADAPALTAAALAARRRRRLAGAALHAAPVAAAARLRLAGARLRAAVERGEPAADPAPQATRLCVWRQDAHRLPSPARPGRVRRPARRGARRDLRRRLRGRGRAAARGEARAAGGARRWPAGSPTVGSPTCRVTSTAHPRRHTDVAVGALQPCPAFRPAHSDPTAPKRLQMPGEKLTLTFFLRRSVGLAQTT